MSTFVFLSNVELYGEDKIGASNTFAEFVKMRDRESAIYGIVDVEAALLRKRC